MRINNMSITDSNRGFTLVELMMTLLIFGVVMGVIGNVFFTSQNLYSSTSQRASQQMSARASLGVMIEEIRHAGANPQDVPGMVAIMTANADQIRVVSELNDVAGIQTDEPSEDVTYRYDPDADAILRNPGTGEQTFLEGVTGFALRYYDENNTPLGPPPLSVVQASRVRSIEIDLTTETRQAGDMNFTTRVGLRNY